MADRILLVSGAVPSNEFRLALIQMKMTDDRAANVAQARGRIAEAAAAGAQVIALPELFSGPYFCQREDPAQFDRAEPIPGPTTGIFAAEARRLGVVIVAPLFERRAPGVYHNSAAVLDADGRLAGVYRKLHIPDDPGYYEKYYFAPGDRGVGVFDTRFGRLGVLICWDQWFPEAARLAALRGAEAILYPTAIGWHPHEKASPGPDQLDAWRTVQRGHAVANGVYVAAVNRVGHERPEPSAPGIEFWGHSFIADPQGVVLAAAGAADETILYADIRRARVEAIRRGWPFLRDRRVDAYAGLDRRFLEDAP